MIIPSVAMKEKLALAVVNRINDTRELEELAVEGLITIYDRNQEVFEDDWNHYNHLIPSVRKIW